jgi:hypothetical protein
LSQKCGATTFAAKLKEPASFVYTCAQDGGLVQENRKESLGDKKAKKEIWFSTF